MNHLQDKELLDSTGARGRVSEVRGDQAVVLLEDGRTVLVPVADISEGKTGYGTRSAFAQARAYEGGSRGADREEQVVPVVEEEVEISKRQRTGGVRVTKSVSEREEVVDEPSIHEDVEVERVAVDRVLEGPVEARQEGDTTIIPIVEEVAVVEKRLVLKEELRITKRRHETRDPQRVTLRREEVTVEDLAADESVR